MVGDNNGRKGFLTGVGGGSTMISALSGGVTAQSIFTVAIPTPRFAYALTFLTNHMNVQTISAYTVDPNTGILNPLAGPSVSVVGRIGISPDGNFLDALCSPTFSGAESICTLKLTVILELYKLQARLRHCHKRLRASSTVLSSALAVAFSTLR